MARHGPRALAPGRRDPGGPLAATLSLTLLVGWWGTLWYPGQMVLYAILLGCAGGLAAVPEALLLERAPSWRLGLAAGALTALVAPVLLALAFLETGYAAGAWLDSPLAALESVRDLALEALLGDERAGAMFLALSIPLATSAFARRSGVSRRVAIGLAVGAAVLTAACFTDLFGWTVELVYPEASLTMTIPGRPSFGTALALEHRLVRDTPSYLVALAWAVAAGVAGSRGPHLMRR